MEHMSHPAVEMTQSMRLPVTVLSKTSENMKTLIKISCLHTLGCMPAMPS